jgi:hypothetical protein
MEHASLLAETRALVLAREGNLWKVAAPLLHGVLDTADSFSLLVRATKVRDSYVVGRTLFETALTTAFVLAGGEPVADRADRHAKQKAYRDLKRESRVAGQTISLMWSGSVDLDVHPDLKAALAEYTGSKGQELRDWTPETAAQQVEAVGARYGSAVATALQLGLFNVFRHGSEVAHGTLFGVLYVLGITLPGGPPANEAEYDRHRCEHLAMLCLVMGCTLSALLYTVARELGVTELQERASLLWEPVQAQGWVKRT